ncbi:hypothetical protein RJ640_004686 [Escallonia rubra]|uniref:Ataxin 2 SM domain-containing protein n=1 Tax=Escallonia rubra TaxID=112253 RepID=A0AA88RS61_9ASTE|nr:hypothetical protein RJ640_004686 [Escallonia rubra]
MGCRRNRVYYSEDNSPPSRSLSDRLLFATMCIIGLPVDVHVKDGSIYSGTFHTACVENDYENDYGRFSRTCDPAIVLKRARMTKEGNRDTNIANGDIIETLVVLSEDLVQVVAKGILLPAPGITSNAAGDDVEAVAGRVPSTACSEPEAKTNKSMKSNVNQNTRQHRHSSRLEKGVARGFAPKMASHSGNALEVENGNGINLAKKEEASSVPVNGRPEMVGHGENRVLTERSLSFKGKMLDMKIKAQVLAVVVNDNVLQAKLQLLQVAACNTETNDVENFSAKMTSNGLRNDVLHDSPAPAIVKKDDDECQKQQIREDISCSAEISSGNLTAVSSFVDTSKSCPRSSSAPSEMIPQKSSSPNRTLKEFKLNPGAKTFSPLSANQRSATPPVMPSMPYVPDSFPLLSIGTPQPEIEISPFAPRSSLPMKLVPYGNLVAEIGDNEMQYSQPIVGHVGNRTQPIRYPAQYHPVQAGPTYMHPNSQNVMVGRMGQLVYVHPVSHDIVQGAAAFSQVSSCPLLTPHQVHLSKHQDSDLDAASLSTMPLVTMLAAGVPESKRNLSKLHISGLGREKNRTLGFQFLWVKIDVCDLSNNVATIHVIDAATTSRSAAAQALQIVAAPPFIAAAAAGQQSFAVPSHIPISQPPFPIIRPIPVPGSNGFSGSKY